jgi:hypothetical protein
MNRLLQWISRNVRISLLWVRLSHWSARSDYLTIRNDTAFLGHVDQRAEISVVVPFCASASSTRKQASGIQVGPSHPCLPPFLPNRPLDPFGKTLFSCKTQVPINQVIKEFVFSFQ